MAVDFVLNHGEAFGFKIGGIDTKVCVSIAIICAPNAEELAAPRLHGFSKLPPGHRASLPVTARKI